MIACAYIPFFAPVVLRERDTLVVIRHFKRTGKVAALSADAERMGAYRELAASRARAICPRAVFSSTDDPAFTSAYDKLLDVLWTYTNQVEIDADAYPHHAIAYLDLGNLRDADCNLMAEDMTRMLRDAFGVGASVGVARGKLTAFLAAQSTKPDTISLVPREAEAAFIAPFDIKNLPFSKDDLRRLRLLGIETLGALASLHRSAVTASFGKRGSLLHRLASGLDGRPVVPEKMPQQETVRMSFDAVQDKDHLDYYFCRLLERLSQTLDQRAIGAHRIALSIHFERGAPQTETLRLLDPASSAKTLHEVVNRLLDRMIFLEPVVSVEICAAHLVAIMPVQLELFGNRPVSKGMIDLARALAARYGTTELFTAAPGRITALVLERRFTIRQVALDGEAI